jgi:hypothetical protein
MISIRGLNLDESLGYSHGFGLINKINIEHDRYNQVLKDVN